MLPTGELTGLPFRAAIDYILNNRKLGSKAYYALGIQVIARSCRLVCELHGANSKSLLLPTWLPIIIPVFRRSLVHIQNVF